MNTLKKIGAWIFVALAAVGTAILVEAFVNLVKVITKLPDPVHFLQF